MPSVNSQVCPQNYNPQRYFSSLSLSFSPHSFSKKLRCCQVFASSKDSDKARARAAAFHLTGIFKKKGKKRSERKGGGVGQEGKICKGKWKWPTVRECPSCWRNWLGKSGLVGAKKVEQFYRPPWQPVNPLLPPTVIVRVGCANFKESFKDFQRSLRVGLLSP